MLNSILSLDVQYLATVSSDHMLESPQLTFPKYKANLKEANLCSHRNLYRKLSQIHVTSLLVTRLREANNSSNSAFKSHQQCQESA